MVANCLDYGRLVAAHEWIGAFFLRERRRQRWLVSLTKGSRRFLPLGQVCICRLRSACKPDVRKRIFMTAINAGICGQSGELSKRRVHLGRRAFEQAAAAACKQGVAAK